MVRVECLDERTSYIPEDTGIETPWFMLQTDLVLREDHEINKYRICTDRLSGSLLFRTSLYNMNLQRGPLHIADSEEKDGLTAPFLQEHFTAVRILRQGGLANLIRYTQGKSVLGESLSD